MVALTTVIILNDARPTGIQATANG